MPKPFSIKMDVEFGGIYKIMHNEVGASCRDSVIGSLKMQVCNIANEAVRRNNKEAYARFFEQFGNTAVIAAIFKDKIKVNASLLSVNDVYYDVMLHYINNEVLPRYNNVEFTSRNVKDPFTGKENVSYTFTGGQETFAALWWSILVERLIEYSESVFPGQTDELPTVSSLILNSAFNGKIWYRSTNKMDHYDLWRTSDREPQVWRWLFYSDGPCSTSNAEEFIDIAVENILTKLKQSGIYDLLVSNGKQ